MRKKKAQTWAELVLSNEEQIPEWMELFLSKWGKIAPFFYEQGNVITVGFSQQELFLAGLVWIEETTANIQQLIGEKAKDPADTLLAYPTESVVSLRELVRDDPTQIALLLKKLKDIGIKTPSLVNFSLIGKQTAVPHMIINTTLPKNLSYWVSQTGGYLELPVSLRQLYQDSEKSTEPCMVYFSQLLDLEHTIKLLVKIQSRHNIHSILFPPEYAEIVSEISERLAGYRLFAYEEGCFLLVRRFPEET